MKLKQLLYGIATFVPGVIHLRGKRTGGTSSARYCYSVWLRHLVMARKNGLNTHPKIVAELGPGDSIGIGLAALISGCDQYYAFDVFEFASTERNLAILDELVSLYKSKTPIPGDDEWPRVTPRLDDYSFPADILDDDHLRHALDDSRIQRIRDSIQDFRNADSVIVYKVPWYEADVLKEESVDMVYSQAVLEHVDDLHNTYRAMHSWLKPSGYMSHSIDFKCHGIADEWNGHWAYSDFLWRLLRGRRHYLLNRAPHSTHIRLLDEAGFTLTDDVRYTSPSTFTSEQLAPRFRNISEDDMITSEAFIQAVKQPGGVA